MIITAWKQDTPGTSIGVATSLALHDVAVAWAVSDSAITSMTALTGFSAWTVVQNTKDGQTIAVAVKTDCTGSEGTVTLAANNNIIGGILGITWMDNTTQPDVAVVTANDNVGSASPYALAAPSLTPATNGALLVALFGPDITAGSATPPTVVFTNSGTGLTWTNQAVSNDGGFRQATIATAAQPTAAATVVTGTGTLASSTAGTSIIVVALRPAAGGATYNDSASDSATATDAATQQLTAPAAATDAATATDSASNLGVLTRSASDAAAATDAATATLTITAAGTDAATATDTSSSASAVNSAATDAIAATDAATQLAVLPAAASDAAAVTDAATNLGVLTRAATDAAAASDAAAGLRVTLGSASDAVTATDTAVQVSAANVTATDAISAADAATVQAVLVGIVSDGFSATDAATLLAGIYNLTAADVLSLLDAALADGGVQYARAPQGAGQDLIYPGGRRPAVISGNRPGNINTARPANRGGRRT